jgi:hypothetical protein
MMATIATMKRSAPFRTPRRIVGRLGPEGSQKLLMPFAVQARAEQADIPYVTVGRLAAPAEEAIRNRKNWTTSGAARATSRTMTLSRIWARDDALRLLMDSKGLVA